MARIIIFGKRGAKILENADERKFYKVKNVIIDPSHEPFDISPRYWKHKHGLIEVMSEEEKRLIKHKRVIIIAGALIFISIIAFYLLKGRI